MKQGSARRREQTSLKERRWEKRISSWHQGDLTIREYCLRHGYAVSTFHRWRRELKRRELTIEQERRDERNEPQEHPSQPFFLPVSIRTARNLEEDVGHISGARPAIAIEICVSQSRTIRVYPGFDPATLSQVVSVLDDRSC